MIQNWIFLRQQPTTKKSNIPQWPLIHRYECSVWSMWTARHRFHPNNIQLNRTYTQHVLFLHIDCPLLSHNDVYSFSPKRTQNAQRIVSRLDEINIFFLVLALRLKKNTKAVEHGAMNETAKASFESVAPNAIIQIVVLPGICVPRCSAATTSKKSISVWNTDENKINVELVCWRMLSMPISAISRSRRWH